MSEMFSWIIIISVMILLSITVTIFLFYEMYKNHETLKKLRKQREKNLEKQYDTIKEFKYTQRKIINGYKKMTKEINKSIEMLKNKEGL